MKIWYGIRQTVSDIRYQITRYDLAHGSHGAEIEEVDELRKVVCMVHAEIENELR